MRNFGKASIGCLTMLLVSGTPVVWAQLPAEEVPPLPSAVFEVESPVEAKPAVSPVETKPAVSPVETKPEVSPVETKPEVSPVEAKPEVSPAETKSAASPVEVKPAASPAETKPAAFIPAVTEPDQEAPAAKGTEEKAAVLARPRGTHAASTMRGYASKPAKAEVQPPAVSAGTYHPVSVPRVVSSKYGETVTSIVAEEVRQVK